MSPFEELLMDTAQTLGWRLFHPAPVKDHRGNHRTAFRGHAGWPDLAIARRSVFLFREVKGKGDRMRPDQEVWGRHFLAAGLDWAIWHEGLRCNHSEVFPCVAGFDAILEELNNPSGEYPRAVERPVRRATASQGAG